MVPGASRWLEPKLRETARMPAASAAISASNRNLPTRLNRCILTPLRGFMGCGGVRSIGADGSAWPE